MPYWMGEGIQLKYPPVGESLGRQVFASSPGISPDSNGDAMEIETFNDLLQMDAFGGTGSVYPSIRCVLSRVSARTKNFGPIPLKFSILRL